MQTKKLTSAINAIADLKDEGELFMSFNSNNRLCYKVFIYPKK